MTHADVGRNSRGDIQHASPGRRVYRWEGEQTGARPATKSTLVITSRSPDPSDVAQRDVAGMLTCGQAGAEGVDVRDALLGGVPLGVPHHDLRKVAQDVAALRVEGARRVVAQAPARMRGSVVSGAGGCTLQPSLIQG